MPALVSSSVGSSGTSDDDGTIVWPRRAKKSRNVRRMLEAFIGAAPLAGAVEDLVPQLRLGLLHGPEALLDGGAQPAADGGHHLPGLGRDGIRQLGPRPAQHAGHGERQPQAQADAGGESEGAPHSSPFLRFPRRVLTPTPAPVRN